MPSTKNLDRIPLVTTVKLSDDEDTVIIMYAVRHVDGTDELRFKIALDVPSTRALMFLLEDAIGSIRTRNDEKRRTLMPDKILRMKDGKTNA